MNFNLGQDKFYRKVSFEIAQGGGSKTFSPKMHFKFKTTQEVQDLLDTSETVTNFLMQVLLGWEDFKDADNQPVDYSEEAARQLFDTFSSARNAAKRTYIDALAGDKSRVKT